MSKDATVAAKFKAIARIASGGMADIYLTEVSGPSGFRKLAVIKRLRPADAEDEEMVGMFMDEARLAARLNHPNIVNTFEVGEDEAGHFIAMEYLEGQPLDRVLRRTKATGDFPLAMQLYVLAQVLGALQYAHELRDYDQTPLGIVHRDVSPHNVFVLYSGQSKLVDFGIAKSANAIGRTRAGAIKGKFAYMAPEQARTEAVDARTDVFAVGLILWEALTTQRLWPQMNESQILHALLSGTPIRRPSELAPDVPAALERICTKAIALSPEDRYASAGEMQIALEDAMRDLDMRVSSREVGVVLERVFGKDRARLRDEVETFLRRPVPAEALPVLALEPTATGDPARQTTASFSNSQAGLTPATRSTSGGSGIRIAVAIAAVAVAAIVFFVRHRAPPPPAAAEPAVATHAPEPPPAPPSASAEVVTPSPRVIRLELAAAPEASEIFLDDVPVPNPFRTRRPADGSSHVVRVVSHGYTTQTRSVTFAEDVLVDIALSPLPHYVQAPPLRPKSTPAPPAGSARPAASAAPSSAPEPPRAPALDDPLTPPPPKKTQPTLDQTPW